MVCGCSGSAVVLAGDRWSWVVVNDCVALGVDYGDVIVQFSNSGNTQ